MGAARKGPNKAASMNRSHPGHRCMPNHPLVLCDCDSSYRTGILDTDTFSPGPGHHQLSSKRLILWRQGHTAGHESQSDVTTQVFSHLLGRTLLPHTSEQVPLKCRTLRTN